MCSQMVAPNPRFRSVYVAFFPETFSCQRSKIRSIKRAQWWRQPGSNRRHPACKAGALPTELCPRNLGEIPAFRCQTALGLKGVRQETGFGAKVTLLSVAGKRAP